MQRLLRLALTRLLSCPITLRGLPEVSCAAQSLAHSMHSLRRAALYLHEVLAISLEHKRNGPVQDPGFSKSWRLISTGRARSHVKACAGIVSAL